MKTMLCIALFSLAASCAAPQTPSSNSGFEAAASALEKNVRLGDLLAERGRFLEAGFYYEAALRFADDERPLLPKLIVAQVKSDRLRAARTNVQRLLALRGADTDLERLAALLETYAPPYPHQREDGKEAAP